MIYQSSCSGISTLSSANNNAVSDFAYIKIVCRNHPTVAAKYYRNNFKEEQILMETLNTTSFFATAVYISIRFYSVVNKLQFGHRKKRINWIIYNFVGNPAICTLCSLLIASIGNLTACMFSQLHTFQQASVRMTAPSCQQSAAQLVADVCKHKPEIQGKGKAPEAEMLEIISVVVQRPIIT